jgi:DNA helicase-2/ATP-dependent DNA helicase PcrA
MADYSLIIGGAGTGKTTHLMEIMDKVIEAGIHDPYQIGFCTFTRAARETASSRASGRFGCSQDDLENRGWFRTIHSIAYRQLNVGKALLTDDTKGRRWLSESLGEKISPAKGGTDDMYQSFAHATPAEVALGLWSKARNSLSTIAEVVSEHNASGPPVPVDLEHARDIIGKFETCKRIDGRYDFTDLLARFAGIEWNSDGVDTLTDPEGDIPDVEAWFLDEQQDSSRLQNLALKRLVEPSRWIYICGDPFQNIYRWAGSDHHLMDEWQVPPERKRILPRTYRCPKEIHDLGEQILTRCTDYFDRGIAPADHDGHVEFAYSKAEIPKRWRPDESTLVLARTNNLAHQLGRYLSSQLIPWAPTQGNGGWVAPKRNIASGALLALQDGYPITAGEWRKVVDYLPSQGVNKESDKLFARLFRGTKERWRSYKGDLNVLADLTTLEEWGATPQLIEEIKDGSWVSVVDRAQQYVGARQKYGYDSVHSPQLKLGTIHSAKGMEADTVFLLTTTSEAISRGQNTDEAKNEERRVEYVAVTRAKRRLIILDDRNASHKMMIP